MLFCGVLFTKLGEDVGRHLAFGVAEGSDLGHIQLLQRLHLMLKKKVITTYNVKQPYPKYYDFICF